jgi:hypothetical protein
MLKSGYFFKPAFVLSMIFLSATKLFAQSDDEIDSKKNSLKISPQHFITSTFLISYERYLGNGTTFQLSGGILAAEKDNSNSYYDYNQGTYVNSKAKDKANGGMVEGILKFYFIKGQYTMSGLYAGPYGKYSNNRFHINSTAYVNNVTVLNPIDYRIESYEGGAVIGYQVIIKNAFVMDMFVGGGIKSSTNTSPPTYNTDNSDPTFFILESQDTNGIIPRAGFRLGFSF